MFLKNQGGKTVTIRKPEFLQHYFSHEKKLPLSIALVGQKGNL